MQLPFQHLKSPGASRSLASRSLASRLHGLRDESGQALVLAAVGLSVITMFLGLAIDVGHLRYVKRNLQLAADAAALAAAIEIQHCGGTQNCYTMQTAAQDALTENGLTGSTVVTNCSTAAVTGLKLMINNPACALGVADPNAGKGSFVEVIVSEPETTYFARLVGWNNVPVSARAEAARAGGASCIFALDPSGGAINIGLAAVAANCGIVDESSSANALTCAAGSLTATQINVVGGVSNLLCGINPTPRTSAALPTPADPLAYLTPPFLPSCGTSTSSPYHGSTATLNITGPATLYSDGAYCGGIHLGLGANVTFQPGTYVITSSHGTGGLSINLGATATGTGVTFYNYGPNGGIAFSLPLLVFGSTQLTAPTTGPYAGILFWQDQQNTTASTIYGTSTVNTVLTGAEYFPKASLSISLSANSDYNIVVAKDINFALTLGLTTLQTAVAADYSTLANGSPVAGTGAVLVQ